MEGETEKVRKLARRGCGRKVEGELGSFVLIVSRGCQCQKMDSVVSL